jgi:hypothetical protein
VLSLTLRAPSIVTVPPLWVNVLALFPKLILAKGTIVTSPAFVNERLPIEASTSSVPPAATVTDPAPRALLLPTDSVPASIVVPPEYVLMPSSRSVPPPVLLIEWPLPEMAPVINVSTAAAPLLILKSCAVVAPASVTLPEIVAAVVFPV